MWLLQLLPVLQFVVNINSGAVNALTESKPFIGPDGRTYIIANDQNERVTQQEIGGGGFAFGPLQFRIPSIFKINGRKVYRRNNNAARSMNHHYIVPAEETYTIRESPIMKIREYPKGKKFEENYRFKLPFFPSFNLGYTNADVAHDRHPNIYLNAV